MGLLAWYERRWFKKLDEGQSQRSPIQERNRKAVLRIVGVLLFIVAAWGFSSSDDVGGGVIALLFAGGAIFAFYAADR